MQILAKDFLQLNDLNKFYLEGGEKREVLRNLSLKIQEGQIVALLGRSGSGNLHCSTYWLELMNRPLEVSG